MERFTKLVAAGQPIPRELLVFVATAVRRVIDGDTAKVAFGLALARGAKPLDTKAELRRVEAYVKAYRGAEREQPDLAGGSLHRQALTSAAEDLKVDERMIDRAVRGYRLVLLGYKIPPPRVRRARAALK
jgi:hypothetical protein